MKRTAFLLMALMACQRVDHDADDEPAPSAARRKQPIGIVTAALRPSGAAGSQVVGYATVVDPSNLFASASQYASAAAQRQQAAAHLQSTSAELQRQRILNADDHNISDRALQETAATAASDSAAVAAATASLVAAQNAARQQWGAVVANGVIANAPWARGLANGTTALLEVAFNGDGAPPRSIGVQTRTAHYLAAAPHVNARLLRPSHYYLATPASEFPVGMTVDLRGTAATDGAVLVPSSAVVWVNGAATVFVEVRPSHYEPRTIAATNHVAEGYVETSLAAGTRVVVQGAQQLAVE